MSSKIKVVGMDISLRNFGFAVAELDLITLKFDVKDLILVQTEGQAGKTVRKNSDDLNRARQLYEGMINVCKGATLAIAEVPVGSQSARAMASYGVCCGVLAACPIPLIQVTPTEVKIAAINEKQAAKEEMIEWAMGRFPTAPWLTRRVKGVVQPIAANEHLADACAAIEAGIRTDQFKQAVALMRHARAA